MYATHSSLSLSHMHLQLGISNDTHVVVYDNNAKFGFYSVGRDWWMFKVYINLNQYIYIYMSMLTYGWMDGDYITDLAFSLWKTVRDQYILSDWS